MSFPCLLFLLQLSLRPCIASAMELSLSLRSEKAPWWSVSLPFMASLPSLSSLQLSLLISGAVMLWACTVMLHWATPGGTAWGRAQTNGLRNYIPGPRGWPVIGSLLEMGDQAHVRLAKLATSCSARSLMAFSLGDTRVILTCVPDVAKEILCSSSFADRPIKSSARSLLFDRAIGFAPHGAYWRNLRRLASTCLFAPRRIAEHESRRQEETTRMLQAMGAAMTRDGVVPVRLYLQRAAVNNIMGTVFGRTYEFGARCEEGEQLQAMVREGFELLGAVNWQDHLAWLNLLGFLDTKRISSRCSTLVSEVKKFVQNIIDEHRLSGKSHGSGDQSDFVDVLLSLDDSEKLADDDMIAVLWEMIFRGTDTTAILTEWVLAELTLHPEMQKRLQEELDAVAGPNGTIEESQLPQLPYLQAVIKETLRMHPPGPLLSWARLATEDVQVAGHVVPAGTTAMVNMWAITHDEQIWKGAGEFRPDRFVEESVDIRGSDLRLAPFGAGRRVCPGRALGYATVQLWVARLLINFRWAPHPATPICLFDHLKLSCEMKHPLLVCPSPRFGSASCAPPTLAQCL
ncbi:hypothetical protein GOP47_0020329 [Adiantum capillus-veneris]|uniref:Cytochrome P450 n=1 Tax=Adiantum capillus-veneris TaxID=13818 RepID=A0A9D4Z8K6_ADICA|nr:hypothetical protein GOP47_0020329 [Adiantum capillus-veneris]